MEKAILRTDEVTNMKWLEFDGKPEQTTIDALKAARWRWGGFRKQWYNSRWDATAPECIEVEDGGLCNYSAEKAGRWEKAADNAQTRANEQHASYVKKMSVIPFGQPIHGVRDRNYRDKAWDTLGRAVKSQEKADWLDDRAEGSAARQAQHVDPATVTRRLKEERKQLESWENLLATYEHAQERATWQRLADTLRERIARDEQYLADAGGLAIDKIDLKKGDLISIDGHLVEVVRVNRLSISGLMIAPWQNLFTKESGYTKRDRLAPHKGKREDYSRRVYTAEQWEEVKKDRSQNEAYQIAEKVDAHLRATGETR